MSIKITQKMLDNWLESSWRDGFTKGQSGSEESVPDFSSFDPRGPEDGKKLSPFELRLHLSTLASVGLACSGMDLESNVHASHLMAVSFARLIRRSLMNNHLSLIFHLVGFKRKGQQLILIRSNMANRFLGAT